MINDFYKCFINLIVVFSLLLALCVVCDYAANITMNVTDNVTVNDTNNVLLVDDNESTFEVKSSDKVYTEEEIIESRNTVPTVTITSKPSCGCRYGYYWHTKSFVDYCPHCHKYGTLRNVHKWPARFEQELTCTYCGADYCGCCGKEKYSYSRYYITKA